MKKREKVWISNLIRTNRNIISYDSNKKHIDDLLVIKSNELEQQNEFLNRIYIHLRWISF